MKKEGIIFIGIPGSGKSTFYYNNFESSHKIVSLDLTKTRAKEDKLLNEYLSSRMNILIDNTNTTPIERKKYITIFKEHNYKVIGYFFESNLSECIRRNNNRLGKKCVPEYVIEGMYNRLVVPSLSEGFDEIYFVKICNGENLVTKIQ